MLDLSIIIVNWNTRDLLAKCLRCVESTAKKVSYETYVVDNASTDGSQDMVRQDFPNVKLIVNTQNVGFASANNQAMRVCQGRYVLLLNSDAFVKENTIDHMIGFMDTHPDAGMAGCKLLYEDGTLQPSTTCFPTLETEFYTAVGLEKLFPNSHTFGKYLMRYWDHNDLREVDVILGAFMMVRREAINQIGMMDDSFFMYSEEVDWCYRFKKAGWKIYYDNQAGAVHLWGGSTKGIKVETLIRLYQSRVHFFRKHYGAVSALGLKIIIGFHAVARMCAGLLFALLRRDLNQKQNQSAYRALLRVIPSF